MLNATIESQLAPGSSHDSDKNPFDYGVYRTGCGKDGVVRRIWGPLAFR